MLGITGRKSRRLTDQVLSDILTADLRERLQSAYSGGGAGFAPMASPLTAFRRTVKTQSKGWTTYNIMQRKAAPARLRENFYVSGWVSQPAAGASTRWESTDYRKRLDSCTTARVFFLSPRLAAIAPESVVRPVAVVGALLCIGFLTFLVFTFMDRKLDRQMGNIEEIEEDKFKVKDLGNLFGSKTFMIVAFLCVLYYSAIFPFQKFAVPMLQNTLAISSQEASDLFAWFPIGAMILTPLLGAFLDFRGKGATMLILGAILMCACHLTFALVPLTKPIAYIAIILLGVSFSLVPAALWPSVPKLVDGRYLGSGYSVIFWIQNLGLWAFPLIIGKTLQATNPGVSEQIQAGVEGVTYNYTVPMLVFASLGVLAFFLGIWLKRLDTKNHYGLELPNVKK